jgi:leukotriene-A4 hydrolase
MPHAVVLHRTLALVLGLGASLGCGARQPAPPAGRSPSVIADPHSHARPDRTAVSHLALDITVEFATRQIIGTAALTVERRAPGAELILDTDGLDISAAAECKTGRTLAFTLGPRHAVLGVPLTVALPPEVTCVAIRYRTSADAKALLWVEPSGTTGKTRPMLFTQSQPILGRTWVPLQDTPSVRFTYDATVKVPPDLLAVMSAENPQTRALDGVYQFHMRRPIPSYLMALAVGDLAFRAIGPRTGVYGEPAVVAAAAREFAEVDAMIATAEKLYGPYRWGRYDMLVLPTSFPFGGMENPLLTFLTPTVITGDRALVSLIAHELAHSWAGNLVTNATWNDVWLNEGITTYVERRIMEALRGRELADLLWHLGRKDLDATLAEIGAASPGTRLSLTLDARTDPDSVASGVAYEKGSLFMRALEERVGRARCDAFLKERFDRLAFKPTDSRAFVADTLARLGGPATAASPGDLKAFLEEWIYKPGVPASAPADSSALAARIRDAAVGFAATGAAFDSSSWKTVEWVTFIRSLPEQTTIERLRALDEQHRFTNTPNPHIQMYWLPLLIARDERAALPAIDQFLGSVGRRWMVREVYTALVKKGGFWLEHGRELFATVAPTYHPVTRGSIAELLAGKKS